MDSLLTGNNKILYKFIDDNLRNNTFNIEGYAVIDFRRQKKKENMLSLKV